MNEAAPTPKRKLRFSLRSLLLAVLLAGSGYGLWAGWEPWDIVSSFPIPSDGDPDSFSPFVRRLEFSRDRSTLIVDHIKFDGGETLTINIATGQALSRVESEDDFGGIQFGIPDFWLSSDGRHRLDIDEAYSAEFGEDRLALVDVRTGETQTILGPFHLLIFAQFSDDSAYVAVCDSALIRIYQRHRPVGWWGILYLKEFWLTFTLTLGLLWSICRDWHGLRTQPKDSLTTPDTAHS